MDTRRAGCLNCASQHRPPSSKWNGQPISHFGNGERLLKYASEEG